MMELKEVLTITKPIEGIYGVRMNIEGSIETQNKFNR